MNPLIDQVEAFLEEFDLSASAFGDAALGDRHFVRQLRLGRDVRQSTAQRVADYMRKTRAARDAAESAAA